MSIRRRLVLLVVAMLLLSSAFLGRQLLNTFRRGYSDVVEGLMFDFASALASQIETTGSLDPAKNRLEEVFRRFRDRNLGEKKASAGGFDVYLTDAKGIVLYSSKDPAEVGRDYSRWRDVYLTLRNTYGARSTRTDPNDPNTSVYFVAAPVRLGGETRGVVSVIKSENSIAPFVAHAFWQAVPYAVLGLLLVSLFAALVMSWVTRPIDRLRDYALRVSRGETAVPPKVDPKELRELLAAYEKMRITLEGRREIETFVQGLVHELKSPLTAIRGSAELALEPIDPDRRARFLRRILEENLRLQRLLDELLRIARLESRFELANLETFSLRDLAAGVLAAFEAVAESHRLAFRLEGDADARIRGDRELVESALRCLVLNALDFSPAGGTIAIEARQEADRVRLAVRDEGPGVPEYARERVFERYFSLERPGKAGKSTGLGLNFVREVMKLHRGSVALVPSAKGAEFALHFPSA